MESIELRALDDAMMRLRRVWALPPAPADQQVPESDGVVELSSVLVVEACVRADPDGRDTTVADVAAFAGVAPSTASRFVRRAADAGLVERLPAPDDARRAAVRVTATGRALHGRAQQFRLGRLATVLDGWSAGEITIFTELLTRFAAAAIDPDAGAPLVPPS